MARKKTSKPAKPVSSKPSYIPPLDDAKPDSIIEIKKVKVKDSPALRNILGITDHMITPANREKKEKMFQRRREVAKLMVEYGYNDKTIADLIGVSIDTIRSDREWLHSLWVQEAVENVDIAKADLLKRKLFVLEEARRAWEDSKKDTVRSVNKKKSRTKGGDETEDSVTSTTNTGNSEFLRLFDKTAEDIAALQGFERDKITTQINITMPSLPSDFSKYGIGKEKNMEVEEAEVEEAEVIEDDKYSVDIDVLEEDEIRRRQEKGGK